MGEHRGKQINVEWQFHAWLYPECKGLSMVEVNLNRQIEEMKE
jgi:hypothetical protein